MAGPDTIEGPLLKVPFEALRRTTRDRKYIIEEIDSTIDGLRHAAAAITSREQCVETFDQLLHRLHSLKRKLDDISKAETEDAQRCKARLEHLAKLGVPRKERSLEWNRQRLDRILADYFLRSGYFDTAECLVKSSKIEALVDFHIFSGARQVIETLEKHDCSKALEWCAENRARLKKIKSKLEFKLRLQEFIELVRQDRMMEAIQYSHQHLSSWAPLYLPELQRTTATLVFKSTTNCKRYQDLFAEEQWVDLIDLFHKELYRLNAMTPLSLLSVHLQAGLSALKTPTGLAEGTTKDDPLHREAFRRLAEGLPFAKHVHSKLVCAVTKEVMNEHNPPMVLPNGYVYSEKAIKQAAEKARGKFVDPRSGIAFDVGEIRRAYIS